MPGMAKPFSALGIPAVKYFPGSIAWAKMQPSRDAPIDFGPMDRYVKEYQDAGFTDLVVALKTDGSWAIRDKIKDLSPKPEYLGDYGRWVQAVVERYDMDGKDDMPGLRVPIRYYEVGVEFSSYEPEPVEHYLEMLEQAYHSAHNASDNAIVMNSAFLATTAFKDHPGPGQYETSFAAVDKRIMYHSLADIRKVLDRPDIFDAVDFHALGDPYEIEDTVNWLRYEMRSRGYEKPIVIGDTATSPLIALGPATVAEGAVKGLVVPPATEADRPRLARYFQKLVDGDEETVQWTQSFAAADTVKKVVVAADMGVALIDTAFMEDLSWLKLKPFVAAAGTSPWAGMTDTSVNVLNEQRTVKGYRPGYYALGQLNGHIQGYKSIARLPVQDEGIRLYRVEKDGEGFWITWYEPGTVILSGEAVPHVKLKLMVNGSSAIIEPMIAAPGQTGPERSEVVADAGMAEVDLTPTPMYISNTTNF
jgi:hypothetical protein